MLRLLGRKTSGNVQKVQWLLEELSLEYSREDYGRQFGNTADAAYLSLNPTGKVPTLLDGDGVIRESNTILRYLCLKAGSDLLPAAPLARAKAELWMDWLLASLYAPYLAVFKASKKSEEERSSELPGLGAPLGAELKLLDDHLAAQRWLAGDDMTVAEFALGPVVHRCLSFPVELPALENLRRWHGALTERPAFQAVVIG